MPLYLSSFCHTCGDVGHDVNMMTLWCLSNDTGLFNWCNLSIRQMFSKHDFKHLAVYMGHDILLTLWLYWIRVFNHDGIVKILWCVLKHKKCYKFFYLGILFCLFLITEFVYELVDYLEFCLAHLFYSFTLLPSHIRLNVGWFSFSVDLITFRRSHSRC